MEMEYDNHAHVVRVVRSRSRSSATTSIVLLVGLLLGPQFYEFQPTTTTKERERNERASERANERTNEGTESDDDDDDDDATRCA